MASDDDSPGPETRIVMGVSRELWDAGKDHNYEASIERHHQEVEPEKVTLEIHSKAQPFKGKARNRKKKGTQQGEVNFYSYERKDSCRF